MRNVSVAIVSKIINIGPFVISLPNVRPSKCANYQIVFVCNTLLLSFCHWFIYEPVNILRIFCPCGRKT